MYNKLLNNPLFGLHERLKYIYSSAVVKVVISKISLSFSLAENKYQNIVPFEDFTEKNR